MIGKESKCTHIYLIDLGLAKRYIDAKSGDHIKDKKVRHMAGTTRYISRRAHIGYEQSRRDDLESMLFLFVYFLKGKLPW